ncbi:MULTISPECIES: deoxyribonuclease IV [unclassified Paenibacillus]|uniref:deoxyribonuclease IV n=1 Tax=unclassified Paenibacillus TaxID=185978 RepID=UPI000956781C|nr:MULTISPECIES: deoxyribonuclease IV [unclassified Paenibacillus]ASS65283.1 deoxyribonuclease IV [Paenibacillus sp. RUD330]SIQ41393.1 Endonuclease IV [Paenibacillus sp. RU4X]SIQ63613.1 Endonuclease IV [Paenibacillus sp. RU4T]
MPDNRIGCHLSTRGGYRAAAERASALGCGSFQYFPKNPRSLGVKAFDRRDAQRCKEWCREHGLSSIAHSPYPNNLASEDASVRDRTAESLLNDLDIAEACGSLGVVVHFGIYKGSDPLEGYRLMIGTLDDITSRWDGKCKLLIENQAGNHGFMGMTLEELAQVRSLCREPAKIAFCLDSCHLFASGIWKGDPGAQWHADAEKAGSLEPIAALHFNDSAYGSGSRRDRHARLGEGVVGEAGLRWLLEALPGIPAVLETASGADGTHREQLHIMKSWEERT